MTIKRWHEHGLTVEALTGEALAPAIADVARLRIAVFRAFPYLYDGDLGYEREYLHLFSQARGAVIVVARDAGRVVGAATGAPLFEVEDDWSAPFVAAGQDVSQVFYCAESVLLPAYRGLGIGHAFFEAREAHARALGMGKVCFCSVVRAEDHPARPLDYRSNDAFWRKRGYAPLEGMTAHFGWRDLGMEEETQKMLQFWGRSL